MRELTHTGQRTVDALSSELGPGEWVRYQRPEPPAVDDIVRYYALAEEQRFYSNFGPCHTLLASRIATFLGGEVHAVPVANCTLGLMAALRTVCGPARGARRLVAVPAFTFTATACAIRWAGYEPLFVDIDPEAWQLCPQALEAALQAHPGEVAAVMGCSTFGTAAPSDVRARWRGLADAHDTALLIDSAAGFGAVDECGGLLGALGETEIFSFHATKPFAVGEGGVIVTPDPELAAQLTSAINFGIDPSSRVSVETGLNAKMPELIAAAALAMLDGFTASLAQRRATAAHLQTLLEPYGPSYQRNSIGSTWQILQLALTDAEVRERALARAQDLRVEVRTCFDPPLHRHPAFTDAPLGGELPVTEELAGRMLSLPMANRLGPRQCERIRVLIEETHAC